MIEKKKHIIRVNKVVLNLHQFVTIINGFIKVGKKANIRNRYNQVPDMTQDTVWESDNTQENITYRRAKKSSLSQQVTTRLNDVDKAI